VNGPDSNCATTGLMPIYEFVCNSCSQRLSFLVRDATASFLPECSSCGGKSLTRAVSGFAYHKSLTTVWEQSGEPGVRPSDEYYRDPRNVGRWTEKRFHDMGLELPSQVDEQIRAAREGVLPTPLKDLESASPTAAYD
jgi:putative FmdB family regulatory protein